MKNKCRKSQSVQNLILEYEKFHFNIHLLHILYFQTYERSHSQWSVVSLDYGQCTSESCQGEEGIEEEDSVG